MYKGSSVLLLACSLTCFLKIIHQHWKQNSKIQRHPKKQPDNDSGTAANNPWPWTVDLFPAKITPWIWQYKHTTSCPRRHSTEYVKVLWSKEDPSRFSQLPRAEVLTKFFKGRNVGAGRHCSLQGEQLRTSQGTDLKIYVENILRDGRVGKGSSCLLFLFSFSKTPWQLGARSSSLGKVTKNQEF